VVRYSADRIIEDAPTPQSLLSFVLKFVDETSDVGKNFDRKYVSVSQWYRGFCVKPTPAGVPVNMMVPV
jgi:hypothetical protein